MRVSRPSFDCRAARTAVEQAICADPVLAARDRQMARLYEQASLFGDPRLDRAQDSWRAARDACGRAGGGALETCGEAAYERRIRELRALLASR